MAAQIQRTKTHEDRVLFAAVQASGSFNYYFFPFASARLLLPRLTSSTRHSHWHREYALYACGTRLMPYIPPSHLDTINPTPRTPPIYISSPFSSPSSSSSHSSSSV